MIIAWSKSRLLLLCLHQNPTSHRKSLSHSVPTSINTADPDRHWEPQARQDNDELHYVGKKGQRECGLGQYPYQTVEMSTRSLPSCIVHLLEKLQKKMREEFRRKTLVSMDVPVPQADVRVAVVQ